MKRCSLFCAGVWPFILLPLLMLLPLLFFKWHAIEADVANNTRKDLESMGASWAKVETRNLGREILITGTPPSKAAIEAVRQKAKQSYGVNSVTISADVQAPIVPAKLNADISGSSIELSGVLPDQTSIDKVVAQANAAFGAQNVVNRLRIGDSIAKLPNLPGYFKALSNKTSELNTFKASLSGQNLLLEGSVISAQAAAELNTLMSLDVDNKLRVVPPPVKPNTCSDLIKGLLKNGKINFATGKAVIEQSSLRLQSKNAQMQGLKCLAILTQQATLTSINV